MADNGTAQLVKAKLESWTKIGEPFSKTRPGWLDLRQGSEQGSRAGEGSDAAGMSHIK